MLCIYTYEYVDAQKPKCPAGMLLERLNGAPVTKKLKHPAFHDVQFVKDMLHSVFTTLELAQGAIGFHHADFRLANVSPLSCMHALEWGIKVELTVQPSDPTHSSSFWLIFNGQVSSLQGPQLRCCTRARHVTLHIVVWTYLTFVVVWLFINM